MKYQTTNILTRRDFIRGTVSTVLGASLVGHKWLHAGETPDSANVVIVRDKNAMDSEFNIDRKIIMNMLDQTILNVTQKKTINEAWLSLFKKDDVIGIVTTPHLNPTHDEWVDAVKKSLNQIGISDKNIISGKGTLDRFKKCTALICFPALKGHWLTGIGTVIKNYILFSGRPRDYHNENSSKLGEIWRLPAVKGKTKLTIVDALYPLCDKGPQPDPRYKWRYNGLIAGTDPVAVEAVCLQIISNKRSQIKGEPWPVSPPPICVEAADKVYGLGTSDPDKIKINTIGWKEELLLS